jgi:hypothetical protein
MRVGRMDRIGKDSRYRLWSRGSQGGRVVGIESWRNRVRGNAMKNMRMRIVQGLLRMLRMVCLCLRGWGKVQLRVNAQVPLLQSDRDEVVLVNWHRYRCPLCVMLQ